MLVEMLIAEMRDHKALTEYDQIFAQEIAPMLTVLPGVQSAYFATGQKALLAIVIVVWASREIATEWCNQHGHRTLVDTLRPYARGDVTTEFFRLEREPGKPERHILN
ncbi:MAG TPA: hypothetical protein VE422_30610 [Terriglobia bacterium]|nr:hypothetical protein [Terriglobia bacterium]